MILTPPPLGMIEAYQEGDQWKARFTTIGVQWLTLLKNSNNSHTGYGTTAKRPTIAQNPSLEIGSMYFDTTLGKPVWIKTLASSITWVDGAGTSV